MRHTPEPEPLADWVDAQAAATTDAAAAVQLRLVAHRLRTDAAMRREFRALLVFTMEADSVAAVGATLDRLHAWALGRVSDDEFARVPTEPAGERRR